MTFYNTSFSASLFSSTHDSEFLVLHLRIRHAYDTHTNIQGTGGCKPSFSVTVNTKWSFKNMNYS